MIDKRGVGHRQSQPSTGFNREFREDFKGFKIGSFALFYPRGENTGWNLS